MKIGIISDTHGSAYFLNKALERIGKADYIIHCGDVLPKGFMSIEGGYDQEALSLMIRQMDNIYLIKGNGDLMEYETKLGHRLHHPELYVEIGNYKFYVTHGHIHSPMGMIMRAKELGSNILCYGHSHQKVLDKDESLVIINPGSTTSPRDGSRSCAILEDDLVKVINIETGEVLGEMGLDL